MIDGTVETVSRDGSGFPDISVSSDMAAEISGIYTVVLTDKSGKTATITLSAEIYEKLVAWLRIK